MQELLQKILEDTSVRQPEAMKLEVSRAAAEFAPWGSDVA